MRAMRTYAKKKEHANAPAGPFRMFSHCACGYNIRKELVYSRRDAEGAENQYDDLDRLSSDGGVSYTYDAAGNRTTIDNTKARESYWESFASRICDGRRGYNSGESEGLG